MFVFASILFFNLSKIILLTSKYEKRKEVMNYYSEIHFKS